MPAKTLQNILSQPVVTSLLSRSTPIDPVVSEVLDWWTLDLYSLHPGPAVNDYGEFKGTDLPAADFLFALASRKAVVALPYYASLRAKRVKEGERHIGGKRFGQLIGLYANMEVFSAGIRMKDMSVITKDAEDNESVGAPRSFTLLDVAGKWHDGWRSIEFDPSAKENDFLTKNKLWTGNSVVVKNWVHPNRWISLYGQYYIMTKMLIARLEEEAKFYSEQLKALEALGIPWPTGTGAPEWPETISAGESESIKVTALQVVVDTPSLTGAFPKVLALPADKKAAAERKNLIREKWLPKLRFAVRSVELAFFKHGFVDYTVTKENAEKLPAWVSADSWERDYKTGPKTRTKWNRLAIIDSDSEPLAVRYRVWEKSESVKKGTVESL